MNDATKRRYEVVFFYRGDRVPLVEGVYFRVLVYTDRESMAVTMGKCQLSAFHDGRHFEVLSVR